MSYELNFNTRVNGAQDLSAVEQAMGKISGATKVSSGELRVLEAALKSSVAAGNSLSGALKEVAASEETFSKGVRGVAGDLARQEAAIKSNAAGMRDLGAAHRSAVTDIQATSASLRVLEGAMPIRAVDKLLVSTLGLGPLFQAAFNIAAPVAFAGVIANVASELGGLYNKYNPIIAANERATQSFKDLSAEFTHLNAEIKKYEYDAYERTHGRIARLRLEADDSRKDAQYGGQARIDEVQTRITAAQARVTAGTVLHPGISDQYRGTIERAGPTTYTADAEAAKADLRRLGEEMVNARLAKTASEKGSVDLDAKATEEVTKKAKEAADRLNSSLRTINDAIENLATRKELLSIPLASGGSLQVESPGIISGADRELSRILTNPDLKNLSPAQQADATNRARAARDQRVNTGLYDAEYAQRNFVGRNPLKAEDEYQNSIGKEESEASKAAGTLAERIARAFEKSVNETRSRIRKEDEPVFTGIRAAGNQQADLTQINARPGGELQALEQSLVIRQNAAALELKIKQIHADEYDLVKAQAEFEDENQKARFEFEKAIAQERKKREGDFRSGAESLASAAITGGAGGVQQYLKGQGQHILTTIAGNVASKAYPTFQKTLGSIGFDQNSPLGGLLQGTPFVKHADPAALSTDLNTKSTDLNTAATLALIQLMGGDTSSIPGASSLASGSTPLLSIPGISSSTSNPLAMLSGLSGGSTLPGLASSLLFRGGTRGIFAGGGIDNQVSDNADDATYTNPRASSDAQGVADLAAQGVDVNQSRPSPGAASGGNKYLGAAGAVAGAAFGAYNGFSKGGVRGDLSGSASILGGAAAIVGLVNPLAGAILGAAALGTSLVASVFGDPRAARNQQITKELGNAKYEQPTSISKTVDGAGNYTDYSRFGTVRDSPFVGNPTVTQPNQYYVNGSYLPIPGGVVSPFSTTQTPSSTPSSTTSGSGVTIHMYNNNMDAKSFIDHADDIAGAVVHHMSRQGGGQIVPAVRYGLGL